MDSSVSRKDQIWFLRVCHHVSNVLTGYFCRINIIYPPHVKMQGEFWGNFQGKSKSHAKGKFGVCICTCVSICICLRIHSFEWMYRLTKALNIRINSDFRLPGRPIAMVRQAAPNDRRLCTAHWQTVKRTELSCLEAA